MARRKRLTPINIADSFCRVVYGRTAYQVVKDVIRGNVPKEVPPEELTEDVIFDAVENVFGSGFFEPGETSAFFEGDAVRDGPFIRFRERQPRERQPRGRPKTQSAAHEYAEWFRIQAERARAERGYDTRAPVGVPEMSRAEARRVLGVLPTATAEEIKQAFRRLALRWHPDVCKEGKERGEEVFKRVALAYHCLCTPQKVI
jgi:hypothetical protein